MIDTTNERREKIRYPVISKTICIPKIKINAITPMIAIILNKNSRWRNSLISVMLFNTISRNMATKPPIPMGKPRRVHVSSPIIDNPKRIIKI
jgi:hypothetical protein